MFDNMGLYQHHDAVTGTDAQFVAADYTFRLNKAISKNNKQYKKVLQEELTRQTGIQLKTDLVACVGAANDTVADCPISKNTDKNEFIVVVHNPAAQVNSQFIKVRLPNNKYEAQLWSSAKGAFVPADSDILEQRHISASRVESSDFEMYVPCDIAPNDVAILRVIRTPWPKDLLNAGSRRQSQSLSVIGFSPENDVIFEYQNAA